MPVYKFSIVIPAYNEAALIVRGLDSVNLARRQYTGGPEAIEMIVADNHSLDATAELAMSRGARVVKEKKRIIGAVRNRGASVANGDILVFMDADTQIHPDTFNAIDRAVTSGRYIAGATGVKLERMSPGIAAAYAVMVPMVWVTGMDTGAVFCRREDFGNIGGYDEELLFAEDVDFLWRFKRLGRMRQQKLARLRQVKAIASTRKFDEHGDWHYLRLIFLFFYSQLFSPVTISRFAVKYWYGEQRNH